MNKTTKSAPEKTGKRSSRRLKYGSAAIAFTAVFIALVVLVNLIFTRLDDKYHFSIDLTSTDIYEIGDTTRSLLADLDEPVTINFMLPRDQLIESSNNNAVVLCAENYEREFDNVSIVYHDIVKDPNEFENLNYYIDLGYTIETTTIIVESAESYKYFNVASCFVTAESDNSLYGFKGEARLTSAILTVTSGSSPVATFTTNHGEESSPELEEMLDYAGFEVKKIDLSKEDIDPATEILVINNPQKDFSGLYTSEEGQKTEIDKVVAYLDSHKDIMLFVNAGTPRLPELEDLLNEWGVGIRHDSLISDTEQSTTNDIHELIANYAGESYGLAMHKSVSEIDNPLKTVVYYATPLESLITEEGSRKVDPVLTTFDTAYITDENGEKQSGVYNLMLLSSKSDYVEGDYLYSHFLVCGTTQFCNTEYIGESAYGNSGIIYSAFQLMGNRNEAVDIDWKRLDDNKLTVEADTAKKFAYVFAGGLPSIVIVIGFIVWMRRRHS